MSEAKARDDRNALASSKLKSSPKSIVYVDLESMGRTPKTTNTSSSPSMTSGGNVVDNDSTSFSKILKFRDYATDEEGVKQALVRDRDDGGASFDQKGTDGNTGHRRAYRYNLTPLPAAKEGCLRTNEDVEDDTLKGKQTRIDVIEDDFNEAEESKGGRESEGAVMENDRVVVGSEKPTPKGQIHKMLPQDRGDDVGPPPPAVASKKKESEDSNEPEGRESNIYRSHSTDGGKEDEPFFQMTDNQTVGRSSSPPPPSYKTTEVQYNGSIKQVMLPLKYAAEDLADLLGSAFSISGEHRVTGLLNVASDGRETVVPLSAFGNQASVVEQFNNEAFELLVYPPPSEVRLDHAKWTTHDDEAENAPGAKNTSLVTFPPTPKQPVLKSIEKNPADQEQEIESSDEGSNDDESEVGDMGSTLVAFITSHVRQGTLGLVHARALLQHLLLDANAITKWSQSISGEEHGGDKLGERNIYLDSVLKGAYTVALWTGDGFSLLDTLKRIAENLLRERRHEYREVMLRWSKKYGGTHYAVKAHRAEEGEDDQAVSASTMMHSELEELIDCVDTLEESGELSFGHYLSLIDSILKGENKEAILCYKLYQLEIINLRKLSEGEEEKDRKYHEKVVEEGYSGSSLHPNAAAKSLHDLLDSLVQIGLSMKPMESNLDDYSNSSSSLGICENDDLEGDSNKENVEERDVAKLDAIRDLSVLLLKNRSIMPAEVATMILDLCETDDEHYFTKMEKYMAGLLSMNESALHQETEAFNSEMHRGASS